MAYDKQTWNNDDPSNPVSGPRMTHIEDGIKAAHDAIDEIDVPDLATVAETGSYTDLANKPTIPTTPAEVGAAPANHTHPVWQISNASETGQLVVTAVDPAAARTAIGAGDGNYNNLINKPTIPTNKSDIGLGSVDNTSDAAKNVLSATKLTTARTINGINFDGTENITVADSTKVPTNRTVAGYALTDNITAGSIKTAMSLTKSDVGLGLVDNTADSTKSVLSATKLSTSRTVAVSGGVTGSASFDGTSNITITTVPRVDYCVYNTGTSSWPIRPSCGMCIYSGGTTEPTDMQEDDVWIKDA